jgi:hypothetical protein
MEELLKEILKTKIPASKVLASVPTGNGLYSIFLSKEFSLPDSIKAGENSCLYVGQARTGLKRRFQQEHLRTGNSGRSAFRRRLGAVLKVELHLRTIPRGDESGKKLKLFKFTPEGEKALTNWILENTNFGWCLFEAEKEEFKEVEKYLAKALRPPLPAKPDWGNPFKSEIDRLNKICQTEAGL